MLSYSNFGSDKGESAGRVHEAVNIMQEKFPNWYIDGEMQVNVAIDNELRDKKYPFSRLKGKEVNTLIFPCLNTANATYKMLQALTSDVEVIGPIQHLKVDHLGNRNPRLHTDEVLIALSICAATDARAKLAMDQLEKLKGLEAHSSVILSRVDEQTFRKLGINLTCEPRYQTKKLYHA
jgi:hypothetical protein